MDKLPKFNFDFRLNSTEKNFFTSLLNLIFRNNSENACLVTHFLTNQMQLTFYNSIKKIEIRFGKFLVNLGPEKTTTANYQIIHQIQLIKPDNSKPFKAEPGGPKRPLVPGFTVTLISRCFIGTVKHIDYMARFTRFRLELRLVRGTQTRKRMKKRA